LNTVLIFFIYLNTTLHVQVASRKELVIAKRSCILQGLQ